MKQKKLITILCLASAVLMSIPWLVPHTGPLALIALVPLLCAERVAYQSGMKRFWIWYYCTFALWNFATTFWVCNATIGGGIAAALINALLVSIVFALFRLSRRHFDGVVPYVFLAAAWICWERLYFSTQISWPWLTLGNAFATSLRCVQWYEYTGVLGGSLWIWIANLGVFGLMCAMSDGSWRIWNRKARFAAMAGLLLSFAVPVAGSLHIWNNYEERSEAKVSVLIAQPNFDPYQKFESLSQHQQNQVLLALFDKELSENGPADLLIAPETFTSDVVLNDVESGATFREFNGFLNNYPGTDMLFGASTFELFSTRSAPSILARPYGMGWIESHNSAIMTDSSARYQVFHKSKLVPAVEMTPYPRLFTRIDDLLGGVMGRCIGQDRVTCLSMDDGTPVGCAVCYESIYGEYCTGYVKAGARLMTVITNDAWWGDTPGYRQHLSYSSLRAIELRRDIARCANTGISAIINQRGEVLIATAWWQEATIRSEVNLNSEQTFFVRYGDMIGRISVLVTLLLMLLLVVRIVSAFRGQSR